MKRNVLVVVLLVLANSSFAQKWTLDQAHSKLGFSITHLMVSSVDGNFKSFDASISSSKDDFSDAIVELTADVNTIDTDNEKRDAHLKAPDFFDASKFPTLSFKSATFKKVADKKYKVTGNLTLHGVTKQVELDVTFNGTAVHPYTKKTIAGFKVTGTIKRSDFVVGNDTPGAVVSDDVAIEANAEFVKE